jgi:hypothetical protein
MTRGTWNVSMTKEVNETSHPGYPTFAASIVAFAAANIAFMRQEVRA